MSIRVVTQEIQHLAKIGLKHKFLLVNDSKLHSMLMTFSEATPFGTWKTWRKTPDYIFYTLVDETSLCLDFSNTFTHCGLYSSC